MTRPNHDRGQFTLPIAMYVAMLIVAVGLAMTLGAGGASGQATPTENVSEKAPYYNGTTPDVNNESWMAGREDPSLDNVTHFVTRLGPFVIGSGTTAQGGVGMAGPMVLGLVVAGLLLAGGANPRVGVVGGAVLFMGSVGALATVGLFPSWLYAVALFSIGLVSATVLIRALR